jgi:ABC-type Mn2+/Zn2+ transport system permease subunit
MSGALWAWFVEPFTQEFMQRALLATLALCVAAPVAGVWTLCRRLVYLADAMSHALLAGVAVAAIIGGSLLIGGVLAALTMALAVALLTGRGRIQEDGAIGVAGQALFAVGVIGVSYQQDPRALSHVLFGNPLTVTWSEVVVDGVLAASVVAGFLLLGPLLLATTFDASHARTVGVRVGLVDAGLLVGLALVVVVGLVSVGVLMAVTLIVAPAIVGRLMAQTLGRVMLWAVATGLVAGVVGLLVAYHLGVPAGPSIALTAITAVLAAAVVSAPRRGSLLRRGQRQRSEGATDAPQVVVA